MLKEWRNTGYYNQDKRWPANNENRDYQGETQPQLGASVPSAAKICVADVLLWNLIDIMIDTICVLHWQIRKLFVMLLCHMFNKETVFELIDANLRLMHCCVWHNVMQSLRWRHNGRDSVSNHQPHDCLLNGLFRRRSKKTSKLYVTGLCAGNSPGTGEFPAQMASNAENVSIWWRHHVGK